MRSDRAITLTQEQLDYYARLYIAASADGIKWARLFLKKPFEELAAELQWLQGYPEVLEAVKVRSHEMVADLETQFVFLSKRSSRAH